MSNVAKTVETAKGSATVCRACEETHDLSISADKTVETSQYRYGSGELACSVCGLNVLDILAEKVINGEIDRFNSTRDSLSATRSDPFNQLAVVVDEAWDNSIPMIMSSGTKTTKIAPGVTKVVPDGVDEVLTIDVNPFEDGADETAEEIQEFLEWCGFETEIQSSDDFMCVSAEL